MLTQNPYTCPFLLLLWFLPVAVFAQSVQGAITDENNQPLPYASVYIKEMGTGTAANAQGNYNLAVSPGTYNITFQFIGYAAVTKTVTVNTASQVVNVQLQPETTTLQTVTVSESAEDPAYSIMRKAIAKAKFHLMQTNSYTAEVYTKGTGQIKKVPWAIKKMAETADEPIDTSNVFTSESVSLYTFEQPNTFKEKVISIRTSGADDNSVRPNQYFNTSFYLPYVVGAVSPLSPQAMSYYSFTYLGSFTERDIEINKIQVTPRSKGDAVYSGTIYITENSWSLHSLFLETVFQGFHINIKQIFGPVHQSIWMPVSSKLDVEGAIFGVEVVYSYLASISNYQINPNSAFGENIIVLDPKIDAIPNEVEKREKSLGQNNPTQQLQSSRTFTTKHLQKLVDAYHEKSLKKSRENNKNVLSNVWYEIDTAATKKDSTYWATRRPVPLTEQEVAGYRVADSLYTKNQKDSIIAQDGQRFKPTDILFGGKYALGESARLNFKGLLRETQFNTVEGLNFTLNGKLYWKNDTSTRLSFTPYVRYGLASGKLYGALQTDFGFGKNTKRTNFTITGGKYAFQYYKNSINPFINSLYTLFLRRNYMRIYEEYFGTFSVLQNLGYKLQAIASTTYSSRNSLTNNTDFSLFKPNNRELLSNTPENIETTVAPFSNDIGLLTDLTVVAKPWLKFRKHNGKLIPIENSSPALRLSYTAGWNGVANSTTDFQQLELGMHYEFRLGVRATLETDFEAGTFLNANRMQFMDFKHFNGGLTEIAPLSVVGGYRLLPYYDYSTQNSYGSLMLYVHFRKFLFTQFQLARLTGLKESLFFNYLKTSYSPDYWEAGYTIDNIFRIMRIELVQSFSKYKPIEFGVRVGLTSLIKFN